MHGQSPDDKSRLHTHEIVHGASQLALSPSPSLSVCLCLTLKDEDKPALDGILERLDPPLAVGGIHRPRELVGGVKPGFVKIESLRKLGLNRRKQKKHHQQQSTSKSGGWYARNVGTRTRIAQTQNTRDMTSDGLKSLLQNQRWPYYMHSMGTRPAR